MAHNLGAQVVQFVSKLADDVLAASKNEIQATRKPWYQAELQEFSPKHPLAHSCSWSLLIASACLLFMPRLSPLKCFISTSNVFHKQAKPGSWWKSSLGFTSWTYRWILHTSLYNVLGGYDLPSIHLASRTNLETQWANCSTVHIKRCGGTSSEPQIVGLYTSPSIYLHSSLLLSLYSVKWQQLGLLLLRCWKQALQTFLVYLPWKLQEVVKIFHQLFLDQLLDTLTHCATLGTRLL